MHNNMLLIVCACRPTDMRRSIGAQTFFELAHEMWIIYSAVHVELVAWHSGERRSLTGELSLSCARPVGLADG